MELRPYQFEILEEARILMRQGRRSILFQSPTGSGKTVLTAVMLKTAAARGMLSLFLLHRREILWQSIRTFNEVGLPHGIIASGFPENPRALVQIASIQTLSRRLKYLKKPTLIVWDEVHHIAAGSWHKIHETYSDAFHIGLSATPCRLDGKGLGKYFQEMIHGPSVRWLIDNGFLSDYKLYAPSTINISGVHTKMGDYNKVELNTVADKPSITGCAIAEYKKLAFGKRAIVFAVSIEHSKHIVEEFIKHGIAAAHLDGDTDTLKRDEIIERFKNGEIKILSNCELFGEGFDLPSIEAAILLRPSQSTGLYLQQVGRALRSSPGKSHAIILDHAGNCARHGLPDQEREWSLSQGIGKSNGDKTIAIKICKKCYAAQEPFRKSCKFCGHVFEIQSREVEEKEGELTEVDLERIRNESMMKHTVINELSQARTLKELTELGTRRGYKFPSRWAYHIHQSRQRKKIYEEHKV